MSFSTSQRDKFHLVSASSNTNNNGQATTHDKPQPVQPQQRSVTITELANSSLTHGSSNINIKIETTHQNEPHSNGSRINTAIAQTHMANPPQYQIPIEGEASLNTPHLPILPVHIVHQILTYRLDARFEPLHETPECPNYLDYSVALLTVARVSDTVYYLTRHVLSMHLVKAKMGYDAAVSALNELYSRRNQLKSRMKRSPKKGSPSKKKIKVEETDSEVTEGEEKTLEEVERKIEEVIEERERHGDTVLWLEKVGSRLEKAMERISRGDVRGRVQYE